MIEWRRNQVLELSSKGYNQTEIAKMLQIDKSIVSRDLSLLRQQSKDNIRKYVDERLPEEYEKCLFGLNAILESWMAAQKAQNEREKIQALNLAKGCYSMKMDMLTNATVIDDAIRFISVNTKSDLNKNKENKESGKPKDNYERLTIIQVF